MATQREANVYITNTSDGNATITLSHNNSTNGTQNRQWQAKPGETVGPLTVQFKTGFGAWTVLDYWWVALTVRSCLKRVAVRTKSSVHLGYEDTNIPYRFG